MHQCDDLRMQRTGTQATNSKQPNNAQTDTLTMQQPLLAFHLNQSMQQKLVHCTCDSPMTTQVNPLIGTAQGRLCAVQNHSQRNQLRTRCRPRELSSVQAAAYTRALTRGVRSSVGDSSRQAPTDRRVGWGRRQRRSGTHSFVFSQAEDDEPQNHWEDDCSTKSRRHSTTGS